MVYKNIPGHFGVSEQQIKPHSTKYVAIVYLFYKIKSLLGMVVLKYKHQRYPTSREER